MLKLHDIHAYYRNIHALKGVSIHIPEGKICCLIGANGAGKSTTLMAISGIKKISLGTILFSGEPIHKLAPEQIVRKGVIQVPEGRRVFPHMTVQENLALGAYLRKVKKDVSKTLETVFHLFPILEGRKRQMAGTMSGGEQQMLAIARAMMGVPRVLLLDEPSLGLAPLMVEQIMAIIKQIKEDGITILLIEQNAQAALTLADYGYVIETGKVVLEDNASDLLENPKVKEAYLG